MTGWSDGHTDVGVYEGVSEYVVKTCVHEGINKTKLTKKDKKGVRGKMLPKGDGTFLHN